MSAQTMLASKLTDNATRIRQCLADARWQPSRSHLEAARNTLEEVAEDLRSASAQVSPAEVRERIETRRNGIVDWINENSPYISSDQKHLDDNTVERAYWHYGYQAALTDVLALSHQSPTAQTRPLFLEMIASTIEQCAKIVEGTGAVMFSEAEVATVDALKSDAAAAIRALTPLPAAQTGMREAISALEEIADIGCKITDLKNEYGIRMGNIAHAAALALRSLTSAGADSDGDVSTPGERNDG